jgi:hypothetical protein
MLCNEKTSAILDALDIRDDLLIRFCTIDFPDQSGLKALYGNRPIVRLIQDCHRFSRLLFHYELIRINHRPSTPV